MSEVPVPYGPKNTDGERLAAFLNGYLSDVALESIPAPENLQCDLDDMDETQKKEWYVYTFHELFKIAVFEAADLLGRSLKGYELGLINRRIIQFLKKVGMEWEE